jgi:hypothetical protein
MIIVVAFRFEDADTVRNQGVDELFGGCLSVASSNANHFYIVLRKVIFLVFAKKGTN